MINKTKYKWAEDYVSVLINGDYQISLDPHDHDRQLYLTLSYNNAVCPTCYCETKFRTSLALLTYVNFGDGEEMQDLNDKSENERKKTIIEFVFTFLCGAHKNTPTLALNALTKKFFEDYQNLVLV